MGKKSRRVKPAKQQMPFVARTFEGLPGEADWVALREIVPTATASVVLKDSDVPVRVCSLLPGAAAGIRRPDGEIWIGLQVRHDFGDPSRDLAHVIALGLETEPGNPIDITDPGVGPRLQDVLDTSAPFDVTVHDGFDWWVEGTDDSDGTAELIAQANESIAPTERLAAVDAAYWVQMGERRFLRWILPHDENRLLDALARLKAAGDERLGGGSGPGAEDGHSDGTRLIGAFRTHGLLVPVWELDEGVDAAALEGPIAALRQRLDEALAADGPLSADERSARNGLASRQLTIR